jgi:hypothetical protein
MSNSLKFLNVARHWFWLVPIVIGLAFVAGGAYMLFEGRSAHDDVRDSVVQEGITVSGDADEFAGEPVDSAAKAQAQSDVILKHTLADSGGYLYAEMGRFLLPEGNYMLPNGTFLTDDGGTTTDASLAALDDNGNPINVTTDATVAALDGDGEPVRAWTSNAELAAKDANGAPVANSLRNTAQTSAFLRTSLGVAVMGFKVSDLVSGLGLFMIVLGITNIMFLAPAVYWAAQVANEHAKTTRKEDVAKQAGSPQALGS